MICSKCGGKCGSGRRGLCPLSFGLALGLTCAIAAALCAAWMGMYGIPPEMAHMRLEPITWMTGTKMALWWLLKGFFFGLVLALIYDLIVHCCKRARGCCCPKGGEGCQCK